MGACIYRPDCPDIADGNQETYQGKAASAAHSLDSIDEGLRRRVRSAGGRYGRQGSGGNWNVIWRWVLRRGRRGKLF